MRLPQGGVPGAEVPRPGRRQRPLQTPQEEARRDHRLHQDRQVGQHRGAQMLLHITFMY